MDKVIDYLLTHSITAGDVIMNLLLTVVGCTVLYSLWRLHKANGRWNNFNLVHLLTNKEGYPDGAKCVELGTWLLMSWGFIVYVTAKALPDWYLMSYAGAFIARGGFGAYLRAKSADPTPAPMGTTTSTKTDTAISSTEVTRTQKGKKP
jgi:hypothetical protein